jgi:predicted component of type VI protein secretion system
MLRRVDSPHSATTPALPCVELEILRGRAKNRIRRVEVPVFLIGAAHDCDLVLADPAFPEVHTYLYVNRGGVTVRRLGEGPMLAVDGVEVENAPIADGQTLRIGSYEFAVRIDRDRHSPQEAAIEAEPARPPLSEREERGIALVRALLEEIRTAIRVESNLKLYIESPAPWQAVTGENQLLVRKATA